MAPFVPQLLNFSITTFEFTQLRLSLDAGLFLFLPLFFLWYFSNGRLMGLGDGLIAIGIGWLLGISGGFTAFIVAVWLALAGALLYSAVPYLMRLFRAPSGLNSPLVPLTMKSEIPFAPFLLTGMLVTHAFALNFFTPLF